MGRGAWSATVHGVAELDMAERIHFPLQMLKCYKLSGRVHEEVKGRFSFQVEQMRAE